MNELWFVLGAILGVLMGLARWKAMSRLGPGVSSAAVLWLVGGMVLRWVLVAGLLVAALQQGIGPGLLAFAGLWLGRWVLVGWLALRPTGSGQADVSRCES